MGVNRLPKTVTRQRRDCDLNPGPTESTWWRGTVVERRSLAGELSLPALDLQLMGDH